ncbi:cytochrome c2 [Thioflavicoccus mobilis 8321]|uniref:Cytochrome c2 n=2 Tax=Thioflavicoccus mobilis TaxID=80679 RepID=L0H0T2_9GAMM|nr:cytochrome c2 [Thioflavicoccus mobilis 8321]
MRLMAVRWAAAVVAGLCWSVLALGALAEMRLDPIAPRLAKADPQRGAKVFLQCKACHVAAPGAEPTVGPNLWNVVGRPVASQPGFDYSEGLEAVGGNWGFETLSRYLFDPRAMAHNSRMVFPGVKPAQQRADLIAYLATLSDSPPTLPSSEQVAAGPAYGGLPEGEGREAVYFTCRACHALEQFTGKHRSREDWAELLETMVADNGMVAPEPWARELMLDYLGAYFGEEEAGDWDGLPPGPGREVVYFTCTACHSIRMVTQQGLSRRRWDDTLDWMVEEQGMDPIEDLATRDLILDYLTEHFGPG